MTLAPAIAIVRPVNVLALAAGTAAGAALAGAPGLSPLLLVPALTAAFGYAWNDAADLRADERNRPARPIPSGRLSRSVAVVLAWACLAAAAAVTWRFAREDARLPVTFLAMAAMLYLYSPWIKNGGVLGPVTVSALSALAVLWGAWLGPHPENAHVAAFIAVAIVFARECVKDIEDLEGDRATGRTTWPVQAGEAAGRMGARVAALAALAALPLPWLRGDAGILYGAVAAFVVAPLLVPTVLRPPTNSREARTASLRLKAALIAGILGLWMGATQWPPKMHL